MDSNVILALLTAAVAAGTPLVLAATGELLAERAGVLNLGVEGMLLMGAVAAFLVADASQNLWLGLLAGMFAGAAIAGIHAFLVITMRANQIVSGLGIVIFSIGLSTFVGKSVEARLLGVQLENANIPLLSSLPILGRVLFNQDPVVYLSWLVVLGTSIYLFRSRPGLWVRSVGESPETADAMGLQVFGIRYAHTLAGGVLAGAGGAYIVLALVPNWSRAETTNGIGWIALALVVFASWRPLGILLGAYLFGIALRLNFALQAAGLTKIPAEFLGMLPYLLTIAVLMLFSARNLRRNIGVPAALGLPYAREQR